MPPYRRPHFMAMTEAERLAQERARVELIAKYLVAYKKTCLLPRGSYDQMAISFNRICNAQFDMREPLQILEVKELGTSTKCASNKVHVKGKLENFGEFGAAKKDQDSARRQAWADIFTRLQRLWEFINQAFEVHHQLANDDDFGRNISTNEEFLHGNFRFKTKGIGHQWQSIVAIVDCRQFESTADGRDEAVRGSFRALRQFLVDVHFQMAAYESPVDIFHAMITAPN